MQHTSTISVFDYTDYRKYLGDYYKEQKAVNPAFSYRYFAQRVKIKSSGFYKEVVDGKRGLSRSLIIRFSEALKLNKKEAEYFENMVYFNEAKNLSEKKRYFDKMMASAESKAYKLHADQYEYFSKWYYVAVRELLSFTRFKGEDYSAIAKTLNPSIRPDQAKKAIQILQKLQLISINDDGYYVKCDSIVTTGYSQRDRSIHTMNIVTFQKTMNELAQNIYDQSKYDNVDMSTLTLSISEETYTAMKDEIAEFRKKLLTMASKDFNSDRVYQLNYHFFPLSKIAQKKEGDK